MWLDMGNIYRVGQSLVGLTILNNSTTVISAIGNRGETGEILEDLRLAPYESWPNMKQYEKEG